MMEEGSNVTQIQLRYDIIAAISLYGRDSTLSADLLAKIDRYVEQAVHQGQTGFHITWGPEAANMTPEERFETIRGLDGVRATAEPFEFPDEKFDRRPRLVS